MKNNKKSWEVHWSYENVIGYDEGFLIVRSVSFQGAEKIFSKNNPDCIIQGIREVDQELQ